MSAVGYGRGSMMIGNAMESVAKMLGADGILAGTTVSFFGPAYNAAEADKLLSALQGYDDVFDPARASDMGLTLENHIADPVGIFIGGNPPTGGTISTGSSALQEMLSALLGGQNTSHNCYGALAPNACGALWLDSPDKKASSAPATGGNE